MKKEDLAKFYLNYRLYIFPIVVALSNLILIIFVIYPQVVQLIGGQKVEKETLSKSKLLEVKAQTLETYDLTDLNRKVNFALSSYPTDQDSVYAMGLLQRLIPQFGYSITAISLGSSAKNTNAQSYSYKVDIVGPVNLFPTLVSNIESSPRLMKVDTVEVTSGNSPASSISFNVEMLYSSAPTTFGSIDSPLPELSDKDEEVIAKLARLGVPTAQTQVPTQLGPRGKANPFE